MRVLVDTPIWSLALRRKQKALSPADRRLRYELTELIVEGRIVMIGPIRQEILSGIRELAVFEQLRLRLRSFDDEVLSADDHEEAARCTNLCRGTGIAGSPVDFLICAAALRRGVPVFTSDADFTRYAECLHLPLYLPRDRTPGSRA